MSPSKAAPVSPLAFLAPSPPELPGWFRDEIQESPEELRHAVAPSFRTCMVQILGRTQHAAGFPLAAAAIPYVIWRRILWLVPVLSGAPA